MDGRGTCCCCRLVKSPRHRSQPGGLPSRRRPGGPQAQRWGDGRARTRLPDVVSHHPLSRRLSQRRSAACSHSRPALCGIRCGGQGRLPQRHERPGDRRPQGLGQCPAGAEAVGALPRHAARRLRYRAGDATAQPSAARTCVSSPATAHLVSHQPAARAARLEQLVRQAFAASDTAAACDPARVERLRTERYCSSAWNERL